VRGLEIKGLSADVVVAAWGGKKNKKLAETCFSFVSMCLNRTEQVSGGCCKEIEGAQEKGKVSGGF
jgi:phosphotransferase system IIB component